MITVHGLAVTCHLCLMSTQKHRTNILSWEANWKIHDRVLRKIESRWPDVQLCVTNNNRCDAGSEKSIDVRLLSSPLLHSLDYSIFMHWTGRALVSDYLTLKRIILQSPRLKKLRLGIYTTPTPANFDTTQFDALPSEALPVEKRITTLRKLALSEKPFMFLPRYCLELEILTSVILRGCVDLPHTVELELHGLSPRYVVNNLKIMRPDLVKLQFPFKLQTDYGGEHMVKGSGDPSLARDAITKMPALEELSLHNHDRDLDILWPAISKHRDSLRNLRVWSRIPIGAYQFSGNQTFLTATQLKEFEQSNLDQLEIDLSFKEATAAFVGFHSPMGFFANNSCHQHKYPHSIPHLRQNTLASILPRLSSLQTLKIRIAVQGISPRFMNIAKNMAPNIFKAFHDHDIKFKLRHLMIYMVYESDANMVCGLIFEKKQQVYAETGEFSIVCRKKWIHPSLVSSISKLLDLPKDGDFRSSLVSPYGVWGMVVEPWTFLKIDLR